MSGPLLQRHWAVAPRSGQKTPDSHWQGQGPARSRRMPRPRALRGAVALRAVTAIGDREVGDRPLGVPRCLASTSARSTASPSVSPARSIAANGSPSCSPPDTARSWPGNSRARIVSSCSSSRGSRPVIVDSWPSTRCTSSANMSSGAASVRPRTAAPGLGLRGCALTGLPHQAPRFVHRSSPVETRRLPTWLSARAPRPGRTSGPPSIVGAPTGKAARPGIPSPGGPRFQGRDQTLDRPATIPRYPINRPGLPSRYASELAG